MARTTSGNVTVNDTLLHYMQDDLPFGGVGLSAMGAYHSSDPQIRVDAKSFRQEVDPRACRLHCVGGMEEGGRSDTDHVYPRICQEGLQRRVDNLRPVFGSKCRGA